MSGKIEQTASEIVNIQLVVQRLRRVEMWRRKRFERAIQKLDRERDVLDRSEVIKVAQLYTAVSVRRKAIEAGIVKP
ncbi:hypothetical protein GPL21_07385 [Bradyrhizobium pachyrhizi]|uniref:Uncharacterized protein n=1 Tax=Bradyrhizobium pachyrhizi TaxID=280333 RepID=A0A844SGP1_9BRAD|nr:hypothetical protein [Bradyrhizobium pachyrhizi]MVT64927.1 hypothetical protein [Bradyrhizobium pachyrhizi]